MLGINVNNCIYHRTYVFQGGTTLNTIFGVTYYLELCYAIIYLFIVYLKFWQQISNSLFGHFRTLASLHG